MKTYILLLLVSAFLFQLGSAFAFDWRTADRSSAGIAPRPEIEKRAVVQVYAARTVRWRKYFGVHSWVAVKDAGADHYRTYHVIGWRLRSGLSVVQIEDTQKPDARWFGHEPELLLDLRGAAAARAIPSIHAAALSYAYPNSYRAWPGPNSNTFISHIIRNTPEMTIELPPTAIGKDWIDDGKIFGFAEAKTGVQFSLFGLLGMTVGLREGFELNLLGLTFGLDVWRPALKLPMIGRVGMSDTLIVEPETEPSQN